METWRLSGKPQEQKVIAHENEAPVLRKGIITIPEGYSGIGKIVSSLGKTFLEGNQSITPAEPDIVIKDEETSLQSAGFPFTVLHTPGHTAGSLSLIDKSTSRAYVGDTMFNIPVLSGRKYHLLLRISPQQFPEAGKNC
ncbi:MAG: MBL fold metallo-hydrolase [Bacteroidales bacterium]|nr:MBL fold metallo-hydrolase [Bacteroidales bacterium]